MKELSIDSCSREGIEDVEKWASEMGEVLPRRGLNFKLRLGRSFLSSSKALADSPAESCVVKY
jgi:hypothetical protein